jgi:hypothetical protein
MALDARLIVSRDLGLRTFSTWSNEAAALRESDTIGFSVRKGEQPWNTLLDWMS